MRTEKELWKVVLDHQEYFQTGLCRWIYSLYLVGKIISFVEHRKLEHILDSYDEGITCYWIGKRGEIQPRIDWINNRIKEL